ncbi:choice-of-anchor B family protein [Marixanthomonas ophiurae]|uniref:Choice-of-anchor B family protein n=1 Tax=Marixanthomonas ophiurae TaxID=387659 RepID=A0A3E1Q9E7_9FLAO|nr:choice-of-anchor B family protein [Marixanthomonas ophiurae]RFN58755.1 choice-of-anchor B family protein [Marixanthomonas ophiurae]
MKKLLLLALLSTTLSFSQTPCSGGSANGYPCNGITLQSHISASDLGGDEGQDSWGWTDSATGKEYALVAMDNGTAFVDISDPVNPVFIGRLESHTGSSLWRDVKVYNNHAYIVSDSNGNHGVQVFDLTRLRDSEIQSETLPINFTRDGRYSGVGSAHNIIINEDTGYAYVLGSNRNGGGPRILDLSDPKNPTLAGDIGTYGYCHDAQVVLYDGPDPDYQGKEILIGSFSSSDYVQILDVTDKNNVTRISRVDYINKEYTHQGWFTEDKRFFIVGDEVDEEEHGFNTKTIVFDLTDLDAPTEHYVHYGATAAIDHNGYVRGNRFYLANYSAGMRVMRVEGLYESTPSMTEINSFDTYPSNNSAGFNGTWNVYPYFESGNLVVTGFGNAFVDGDGGLFILKDPNYDNTAPTVVCQPVTATLDRTTGSVTITADDVDNGSTDDFGIVKKSIEASQTTFTCADVGRSIPVTLTVEDDYGNKSSCNTTITVEAETTSYNGASWSNGAPSVGSNAKISADYNTATNTSFQACSCEVDTGRTLTVNTGDYVDVQKDITVNGTLMIAHEGSVVQRDNDAVTTNNGTISVQKITPNLEGRDFMILGSPVSGETRNGVYGTSVMVRNHITENFVPNPQVENDFPLAENFADNDGDNWVNYTGNINAGEGYLVRPQTTPTGTGSFTLDYTQGTLNNGIVNFNLVFNTEQNDSPNMLGNPYPSAIDAQVFLAENTTIDALYFWEHLTAPNPSYPGYNPNNYNMSDISMYNAMGGTAAGNDPGTSTRPNDYIASGQGFGVKTTAAGTAVFNNSMRVTDNNDTYREPAFDSDRIWLNVYNEKWEMGSAILIGFSDASTNGLDTKFDTKRLATPVSLYSTMPSGEQLAIQGLAPLKNETQVSLGFDTQVDEETEYRVSINDIQGATIETAVVYLIDNKNNTVTNLSESDYAFTAEKGQFTNRFTLQFKKVEILGTEESLSNIAIFPNPANTVLNIVSPNTYLNNISVYDLLGRRIDQNVGPKTNSYQLNLASLHTGIYFVKIDTEMGTITKKLIKK